MLIHARFLPFQIDPEALRFLTRDLVLGPLPRTSYSASVQIHFYIPSQFARLMDETQSCGTLQTKVEKR